MSDDRRIPGRASSQVSIYDYPEHLNPFYEDENHKRLRFWKINSSSKGQKTGRSNSFSLSGLKDMWAFKSFKLKKKSSTLGVNKTSESPPELRKVYPLVESYNTVDSRMRHTYDVGLGNNFQRSGYRSSLQNVHSTGLDSNGFYRNDRYRSTIQNGSQTIESPQRDRYVYSGSVTPTPRTRYATPQSRYGSSQTSINSTNPFDEDDNISRCESVDGVSLRKRKKRKAPQPPVTSPAVSANQQACTTVEEVVDGNKEDMADISNLTAEIESFVRTHNNDQEELRENHETYSPKKKDKSPPIPPARTTSNTITVVATKNPDNETVTYSETTVTIEQVPTQTVVTESHTNSVQEPEHPETTVAEVEKVILTETSNEDAEHKKLIERKMKNSRASPENNEDYPERMSQTPDPDIVESVKIRKVNSVKQLNVNDTEEEAATSPTVVDVSPPRIIIRKPTEDWEYDEELRLNDDDANQTCSEIETPKTPISSEVEFILEQNTSQSTSPNTQRRDSEVIVVETVQNGTLIDSIEKPAISTKKNFENSLENSSVKSQNESVVELVESEDVSELKIVESSDDLTKTPNTPITQSTDKYKIRFVALKNFSPEPQRRDVELRPHNNNNQEFDVEDIDLPPAPPQRRRSVKDIIASINKSQSLLKINQKTNGNTETKRTYNYESYLPQTISSNATTPIVKETPQSHQPKSSDAFIDRKYSELEESERKMRTMIKDMEQSTMDVPVPVVEKFDEFIVDDGHHSNDLFKKCVVRREKSLSSGASQESRSSVEWNPLPKPRRSRNLTHELENGKI